MLAVSECAVLGACARVDSPGNGVASVSLAAAAMTVREATAAVGSCALWLTTDAGRIAPRLAAQRDAIERRLAAAAVHDDAPWAELEGAMLARWCMHSIRSDRPSTRTLCGRLRSSRGRRRNNWPSTRILRWSTVAGIGCVCREQHARRCSRAGSSCGRRHAPRAKVRRMKRAVQGKCIRCRSSSASPLPRTSCHGNGWSSGAAARRASVLPRSSSRSACGDCPAERSPRGRTCPASSRWLVRDRAAGRRGSAPACSAA